MDTGAGRRVPPAQAPSTPVGDDRHKRKHSSSSGQFNAGSNKRAKPLADIKSDENSQTSLSLGQIDNVDQKLDARKKASHRKQSNVKVPKKAEKKRKVKVKTPKKADQKGQSVLDGFFTKAPVPSTSSQIAETSLNQSSKGSKGLEQNQNDGWGLDWESDVNGKDDYSYLATDDKDDYSYLATDENDDHSYVFINEEPIGDNEVIPGPEGEDCSADNFPDQTNVKTTAQAPDLNGQLLRTIREVVLFLKKWASETSFMDLQDRPITLGFWHLLSQVDVDVLMDLWAPAISTDFQALFEKHNISVDDLGELPLADDEKHSGIYLGFIVEAKHDDGTVTLALYVGSSIFIKIRVSDHQREHTWNQHKGSRLYQKLKNGAEIRFCVLAAFNSPIERGYLNLLEGIFIFLFGALLKPPFESDFVKLSTWELYETLQATLGYCPPFNGQIVGLNLAWPLIQDFSNAGCGRRSKCINPQCMIITLPRNEPEETQPLADGMFVSQDRILSDPGDPLGYYLCPSCYFYWRTYEELPDAIFARLHGAIRYYRRWIINERRLEHKITCSREGCDKVEDPVLTRNNSFVMDQSDPSKFYCRKCWRAIQCKAKHKEEEFICRNPACGARLGRDTLVGKSVDSFCNGLCIPCWTYMRSKSDNANNANEEILDDKIRSRTRTQIKIDLFTGAAFSYVAVATKGEGDDIFSHLTPVFSYLRPESDILQDWWTRYGPLLAARKLVLAAEAEEENAQQINNMDS
ncbi:unnamed protein product [Penicillium glandicola]